MPGPGYKAGKGYVGKKKRKKDSDSLADAIQAATKAVTKGSKRAVRKEPKPAKKIKPLKITGRAEVEKPSVLDVVEAGLGLKDSPTATTPSQMVREEFVGKDPKPADFAIAGLTLGKGKGAKKAAEAISKVFKRAPKKPPPQITKKAAEKSRRAEERLEKAVRKKEVPRATRAKQTVKRRTKERYSPAAKLERRSRRLQRATIAAPTAGAVGTGIALSTGEALVDDPKKTVKATINAIPQMGTAIIGDVAALARGDVKHVAKEYQDYFNLLSGIASNEDKIKVGETPEGKPIYRSAKEAVQKDVGLLPAIMGGVTAGAVGRGVVGRPKVRKFREARPSGKPDPRGAAASREARSRTARIYTTAGERARQGTHRAFKEGGLGKQMRKARRRKVAGRITEADVVRFVGATGIRADSANKWLAKARKDLVEPSEEIPGTQKSTREVLDAIETNPTVLDSPRVLAAIRGQEKAQKAVGRERGKQSGLREDLPEDARARQVHQANLLGELLPEESPIPGITARIRPRKGQRMERAVRETARRGKKRRAPALRRKAERAEARARAATREARIREARGPERSAILARTTAEKEQRRAANLREQADRIEATAAADLAVVNRLKRADSLEKRAVLAEHGKRELKEGETVEGLKAEAQRLRREHFDAARGQLDDFNRRMTGARKRGGLAPPVFFKEGDITDTAKGGDDYSLGIPASERMRSGSLHQQGRVREAGEDVLEGVAAQQNALASTAMTRNWIDEFSYKSGERPLITTKREGLRKKERGEIPEDYVPLATQEFNRAYQRGRWQEAQGLIDSPIHAALRESRHLPGKKYAWVPRAALDEFKKQGQQIDGFFKGLRSVGRVQSGILLALSPLWFAWQIPASALPVLLRNPNVLRWPAAAKRTVEMRRKMNKAERDEFDSYMGSATGAVVEMRDLHMSTNRAELSKMARVARRANQTWAGQLVEGLRRGGPFIQGNRRYEAAVREFEGMLEIDKLVRESRRPTLHRFANSVSELNHLTRQQIAELKGKSTAERVRYFNDNPVARRELERRVDDAIGNWTALTTNEKKAAAVAIFYPFIRFSLRWTTYAYPKNNPMKASLLATAASINAIQLELAQGEGEDLGSVFNYGQVLAGDGTILDLHRMAPGSNAVFEAVGGSRGTLQQATAPTQPLIAATLSALAGQDPYTGRQKNMFEGGDLATAADIFLKEMAGLPVPTRTFAEQMGDKPSVYSELFRKMKAQHSDPTTRSIIPRISLDPEAEQDVITASRAMDFAFSGTGDERTEARNVLATLFRKYGLEVPTSLGAQPKPKDFSKSPQKTSVEDWTRIPGIGETTAQQIVKFFEQHPSASLEATDNIEGIGPTTLFEIQKAFEGQPTRKVRRARKEARQAASGKTKRQPAAPAWSAGSSTGWTAGSSSGGWTAD